jgi:hypothetical protein
MFVDWSYKDTDQAACDEADTYTQWEKTKTAYKILCESTCYETRKKNERQGGGLH